MWPLEAAPRLSDQAPRPLSRASLTPPGPGPAPRAPAERGGTGDDPRVPPDRGARGAVGADAAELPARPRAAPGRRLPSGRPDRVRRGPDQSPAGGHTRDPHVR